MAQQPQCLWQVCWAGRQQLGWHAWLKEGFGGKIRFRKDLGARGLCTVLYCCLHGYMQTRIQEIFPGVYVELI